MQQAIDNLQRKHRHNRGQINDAADWRNETPYGLKYRQGNEGEELHQRVAWIRAEPRENDVEKEHKDKEPGQIHDDSQTVDAGTFCREEIIATQYE